MAVATAVLSGTRVADRIAAIVPGAVEDSAPGYALVRVERIVDVCRALHGDADLDAKYLALISGVDRHDYFEVVYHLASLTRNHRFALKVRTDHDAPQVPSVSSVWTGALLQEREVYDLMGISFSGHPELKRIFLWDGFPGHPLRKDFMTLPGGVSPGLQRFPKEDPEQWGGEFRAD